ncbi:MAG: tetratricopeptide repeat protein [Aliidongia sp.]
MIAEGRRYLDRILPLLGRDPPPTTAAHILRRAAVFCHASDDPAGQAHAERAAALYRELGDRPNLGRTLCIFVVYHASQGRYAEAKAILLEAQQLLADSRFKKSQLILTNLLGIVSDYMMNPEDARRYFIQAVELAGAVQSVREPMYLSNLGIVEHMSGNIDRAIEVTRAALSRARLSPGHYILGHLLCNLGGYFLLKDNLDEARPLLEEALSLFASRHDYSAIMFLPPLAVLLGARGASRACRALIGYVEAERARRKMTAPPDERPLLDKLSTLLSAGLQPVEIEARRPKALAGAKRKS